MPKISICIPFHWMKDWPRMMERCLKSIEAQTFKDYEVILIKHSTMPVTSNRVIESAKGELIKILYMDDYLAHSSALEEIVRFFEPRPENPLPVQWVITGCLHDTGDGNLFNYHEPTYNDQIYTGVNTVGSPSVLTFRREGHLLFDTSLSWLLDCDLYKRLNAKYGPPTIVNTPNVVIGIGVHQTSSLMPSQEKQKEFEYIMQKYNG